MSATVRGVAVLVIPTLVLIGSAVALTDQSEAAYRHSLADSSFEAAYRSATGARAEAMATRILLGRAIDEAAAFADESGALVTAADNLLDAEALVALTATLDGLTAGMPVPLSIPVLPSLARPAETGDLVARSIALDKWTVGVRDITERLGLAAIDLDRLAQAVEAAYARVAASADAIGSTVLADATAADAEARLRLEASLEAVSTRLGVGALPTGELLAYLTAAKAVRDSHAAAVEAAAAASAGSTGSGGGSTGRSDLISIEDRCRIMHCVDLSNPPVVFFYDNYVGDFCPYSYVYMEQYSLDDGEWFEVYPDYPGQPYGGRVIPIVHNWALLLEFCA